MNSGYQKKAGNGTVSDYNISEMKNKEEIKMCIIWLLQVLSALSG